MFFYCRETLIEELRIDRLPTRLEMLKNFLYFFIDKKLDQRESAIASAKQVFHIWSTEGRDPQMVYRVADKIHSLFGEYNALKKQRNVQTLKANERRTKFLERGEEIFDISKEISKVNNGPRYDLGSMVHRSINQLPGPSNVDTELLLESPGQPERSNDSISVQADSDSYQPQHSNHQNNEAESEEDSAAKIKPDKDVCLAFDRAGVSNTHAHFLFLNIAKCLGHNVSHSISSTSTMRRYRREYRKTQSGEIKNNFDKSNKFTVHWDS